MGQSGPRQTAIITEGSRGRGAAAGALGGHRAATDRRTGAGVRRGRPARSGTGWRWARGVVSVAGRPPGAFSGLPRIGCHGT